MSNIKKERWRHWWNGEVYDRPVFQITAPLKRAGTNEKTETKVDAATAWGDIEYIFGQRMKRLENTLMLAEAALVFSPGWSVGNACMFGCVPKFAKGTVWVDPLPVLCDGYPAIMYDPCNPWLKWMYDFLAYCVQRYDGRFYLTPHFGNSAADILSLLRSNQELMIDVIDNPEWVRNSLAYIAGVTYACWDKASSLIGEIGHASWYGCEADGPVVIADADISCMVSPACFNDLFLPQIAEQTMRAPYSQYHLDGPGALAHLDALLGLPALNAIQWVPGAGNGATLQWVPIIRKVQNSGKAIQVYAAPGEVMPLLDAVDAKGLCVSVHCNDEKEAYDLLDAVNRRYGIG